MSLKTRHTNSTSLPTAAVWLAGSPFCRMGLLGRPETGGLEMKTGVIFTNELDIHREENSMSPVTPGGRTCGLIF